jgi:hypothetical protein
MSRSFLKCYSKTLSFRILILWRMTGSRASCILTHTRSARGLFADVILTPLLIKRPACVSHVYCACTCNSYEQQPATLFRIRSRVNTRTKFKRLAGSCSHQLSLVSRLSPGVWEVINPGALILYPLYPILVRAPLEMPQGSHAVY